MIDDKDNEQDLAYLRELSDDQLIALLKEPAYTYEFDQTGFNVIAKVDLGRATERMALARCLELSLDIQQTLKRSAISGG